ncbi:hypothetical protein [Calothrix sp. UHCC 0171]|uniref:hypothetical protein n=1 Tax=Calothrix sp. UHCC 0171 TaxID=3110245 RepID=UPI002B2213BC|nr:hypothetical protein [Calothrix sp. UHCC 0171]MEA5570394.1 hypothetical protein [Calothrix sp. UHCC 0171]
MAELYLYLFIFICAGLLIWGLVSPERVYQYPFFMGGIIISFILPQAIALFNNPLLPNQEALERVLLMCCLCAAMCWFGYQLPINRKFVSSFDAHFDDKKMMYGGIVFTIIGYIATILINLQPESVRANTQWTGIITIYFFFSGLIYPGFSIFLLSALKRPTFIKFALTAFAAAIPIQTIILYGRREVTATFILSIGLSICFFRRYVPPRWLAVGFIILALFAIPLIGEYRTIAKSGNWEQLWQLKPVENLQNFVMKGKNLELRNAALLMDAAVKNSQYGFGTQYWDSVIFQFVPAQFLSAEFKNNLQFKMSEYDTKSLYGYTIPVGTTITGIGDSFTQFDYLGCMFFVFVAYIFKNLWIAAIHKNSLGAQLFYISLFSPAMLSITHGTTKFFADLLFRLIFMGGLLVFARVKTPQFKQFRVNI